MAAAGAQPCLPEGHRHDDKGTVAICLRRRSHPLAPGEVAAKDGLRGLDDLALLIGGQQLHQRGVGQRGAGQCQRLGGVGRALHHDTNSSARLPRSASLVS